MKPLHLFLLALPLLAACTDPDEITVTGGRSYDHIVFTADIAPTEWSDGDSTRTDVDGTQDSIRRKGNNDLRDVGDGLIFSATDTPMTPKQDSIATRVGDIIHYNGTSGNVSSFRVSAKYSGSSNWYFQNKTARLTTNIEDNKKVWEIDDNANVYRWPGQDLKFYAVMENTDDQDTKYYDDIKTNGYVSYTMSLTNGSSNEEKRMAHDFSVASTAALGVSQKPVPLTFRHALAAIRVNIGPAAIAASGSGENWFIKKITLSGLMNQATLMFDNNLSTASSATAFKWIDDLTGNYTHTGNLGSVYINVSDVAQPTTGSGTTDDVVFFVLPQTLSSGTLTIYYTQGLVDKTKSITLTNQTYRAGVITTYQLDYFRSDFELDIDCSKDSHTSTPYSQFLHGRGFSVFSSDLDDDNDRIERRLQYRYVIDWGDYNRTYVTSVGQYDALYESEICHQYASSTWNGTIKIMCVDKKMESLNCYENTPVARNRTGKDLEQCVNNKITAVRNMTGVDIYNPKRFLFNCENLKTVSSSTSRGLFENSTGSDFSECCDYCYSLQILEANTFSNCTNASNFTYAFEECNSLQKVADGLFPSSASDLSHCFTGCSKLTITSTQSGYNRPFSNLTTNIKRDFDYLFSDGYVGCPKIISLPSQFFPDNSGSSSFEGAFRFCTGLTTLPPGLFPSGAKTFSQCFQGCTALSSIMGSTNVGGSSESTATTLCAATSPFSRCTKATDFSYCFSGCTNLTLDSSVTWEYWYTNQDDEDDQENGVYFYFWQSEFLFYNCIKATNFQSCFSESGVKSARFMFGKNRNATNFHSCFFNCKNLVITEDIFSTRTIHKNDHYEDDYSYTSWSEYPETITDRFYYVGSNQLIFNCCFSFAGWGLRNFTSTGNDYWGNYFNFKIKAGPSIPRLWLVQNKINSYAGCFYGVNIRANYFKQIGNTNNSSSWSQPNSYYDSSTWLSPVDGLDWVSHGTRYSYSTYNKYSQLPYKP